MTTAFDILKDAALIATFLGILAIFAMTVEWWETVESGCQSD